MKSFEDTNVLCAAVLVLALCVALNLQATWTTLGWLYDGGLTLVQETYAFFRALV